MVYLVRDKIIALQFEDGYAALRRLVVLAQLAVERVQENYYARHDRVPFKVVEQLDELLDYAELGTSRQVFYHLRNRLLEEVDKFLEWMEQQKGALPALSEPVTSTSEARKRQLLDSLELALLMIEQDHQGFFQSRKGRFNHQPHDRIFNHLWLFTNDKGIYLRIQADSGLPEVIREEITQAFQAVEQKGLD